MARIKKTKIEPGYGPAAELCDKFHWEYTFLLFTSQGAGAPYVSFKGVYSALTQRPPGPARRLPDPAWRLPDMAGGSPGYTINPLLQGCFQKGHLLMGRCHILRGSNINLWVTQILLSCIARLTRSCSLERERRIPCEVIILSRLGDCLEPEIL